MVRPGSFCHSKTRNDVNKKKAALFAKDTHFIPLNDKFETPNTCVFLKITKRAFSSLDSHSL